MKNPVTEQLITTLINQGTLTPDSVDADNADAQFLRDFYHRLSKHDFATPKAQELCDAALRHRQFAETRKPGTTLLEIYNLELADNHAQSVAKRSRTIVNLVADNKPFLIDSLIIHLNALHKSALRLVNATFAVRRDSQNRMQRMVRIRDPNTQARGEEVVESYIQLVIDFTPKAQHRGLRRALQGVLEDVDMVVADWQGMRGHALKLADAVGVRDASHAALLRWMENHHFAFLGYAEVLVEAGRGGGPKVRIDPDSLLGVCRAGGQSGLDTAMALLPPLSHSLDAPLIFTKSGQRTHIHRDDYLDCIMLAHPRNSTASKQIRLSCFLGFLAGSAARLPTTDIPYLGEKTAYVIKTSTLLPGGYTYKALVALLETLPREKLFQMRREDAYRLCMSILNHLGRRKTRVHVHRNVCGHFYSCLVYVPRDLFNSTLRQQVQDFLAQHFRAAEVTYEVYYSDSILTRIHYVVHCDRDEKHAKISTDIEAAIQGLARDWNENLHAHISDQHGHEHADKLLARYRDAFSLTYQNEFDPPQAARDIARLEKLRPGEIHTVLCPPRLSKPRSDPAASESELGAEGANFKLYCAQQPIALSDALPILEQMGIRVLGERPYRFQTQDGMEFWLHDFEVVRRDRGAFDFATASYFQATFAQTWCGAVENDGFNQLTLLAGLRWKQISLLRAYTRYLKQIRLRYSEQYIVETLSRYPKLATLLCQLFDAKFNPESKPKSQSRARRSAAAAESELRAQIDAQLAQVSTLDEDRIVNALLDVINATLRTNYYQTSAKAAHKPCLSLKLRSEQIPRIPMPAPKYEIFVYSPRVEGVHLRTGEVARGGLRWSERLEDFRTEVLGLVKAQRVKNAVIVPMGSKGGFIAKQLPADGSREQILREVTACYRLFIGGLLDLTDNLRGGKVVPPPNTRRGDGDDPYLVVAADKGTATFSDIANEISETYGFWLGDAFASGGSVGYDHKKMGITARGAWESVKRHFRELGKDIQREEFTVIGIGDMGGDVFGNGMLLSKHIRLVAAFNHQHIFIDPNPDPAASYAERKRLFALPRSSWDDYERKCISRGGGVFSRAAKSIPLSAPAQRALGIDGAEAKSHYAPDALIHLILKAPVELLWNGGIGTYAKAARETHAQAQDKSNDALRVDAAELRCKVIGEGGNLGLTQLARIEFAQNGGLCYTDAIDNSAGVDTSDHEVNIKILLNAGVQQNQLSAKQRNALLASMEREVAELVLRNNYQQAQTVSIQADSSEHLMPEQAHAINALAEKGLLNCEIEFLPNPRQLQQRWQQGKWLTRPEVAVLLAYAKLDVYQGLLQSELPRDSYLAVELARYFPPRLAKKFPQLVQNHQLGPEIIATQITNQLVGIAGPSFHIRMMHLTDHGLEQVVRAWLVARDVLDFTQINAEVEALDNRVAAPTQRQMLETATETLQKCAAWVLRQQRATVNPAPWVATFRPACQHLHQQLKSVLGRETAAVMSQCAQSFIAQGVPQKTAHYISALPYLARGMDITDIVLHPNLGQARAPLAKTQSVRREAMARVGWIYFQVRAALGVERIERAIQALPTHNDWHERAGFSLASELRDHHAAITRRVLADRQTPAPQLYKNWQREHRTTIARISDMRESLQLESADFAMLSVLVSELGRLY